jgi:hypothetical protein
MQRNETMFVRVRRNGQWKVVQITVAKKRKAAIAARLPVKHNVQLVLI